MSFLIVPGRIALVCAALATSTGAAFAAAEWLAPTIGVTERYASEQRTALAIGGYDPVSYRFDQAPRIGRADCGYLWKGLVWQFAGEANRAAFMRDPDRFAPRIGGYDAERIGSDVLVAGNPEVFLVQSEALYLFRSAEHRRRFLADSALAAKAEATWVRVAAGLVQG